MFYIQALFEMSDKRVIGLIIIHRHLFDVSFISFDKFLGLTQARTVHIMYI